MPPTKDTGRLPTSLIERLLASQCPGLDLSSLAHIATGWCHDVWRCDDTLLRFPLHEEEDAMSQKGALLAHLGERLDVQLPERTHRGRPTAEYAGAFAGYRWIKGESLLRVTALSASERESLVKPLATLLRTLHQFGVPATQKFGLSITDRQEELSLRTEKAQVRAGELASSAFAALSARAAEAMTPAPPPCASADYRLVHGDLHAGQILVDPDRRVTALIDWDDARLGDPAYDLQMVYSFVPPSSRPSFWNIYGPFKGHRRARHLALSYGLAFLGRAMRDGDSELADGAASQLHNALR